MCVKLKAKQLWVILSKWFAIYDKHQNVVVFVKIREYVYSSTILAAETVTCIDSLHKHRSDNVKEKCAENRNVQK